MLAVGDRPGRCYAEGRVEQSTVESLFRGSVTAVPPVFPNDTGHSSKDNHCSDSYEPGHDAEDRTDRSVRLAVRDDRFREIELRENAETAEEDSGNDRRRQQ